MATASNSLLADTLSRLRDVDATAVANNTPPTTANGEAFVYQILSYCETHVNHWEKLITQTTNLLLTANTTLYKLSTVLPSAVTIVDINVPNAGDLDGPVNWKAFGQNNTNWLTAIGASLTGWSQIGKDLLALVPSIPTTPTVAIRYLPVLSALGAVGNINVPDNEAYKVSRLATLVLRIKTRQIENIQDEIQTISKDLQIDKLSGPKGEKAL